MERLNPGDKKVIEAFLARKEHTSKKLYTDGKQLDIQALGGIDIAHWNGSFVEIARHRPSGRSDQVVIRGLRRMADPGVIKNKDGTISSRDSSMSKLRAASEELGRVVVAAERSGLALKMQKFLELGEVMAKAFNKEPDLAISCILDETDFDISNRHLKELREILTRIS